jgi:hypothetical protein
VDIDISMHTQLIQIAICGKVLDGTFSRISGCNISTKGHISGSGKKLHIAANSAVELEFAREVVLASISEAADAAGGKTTLYEKLSNEAKDEKAESSSAMAYQQEAESKEDESKLGPLEEALFQACAENDDILMYIFII